MKKLPLAFLTLFILTLSACGGNASRSAQPGPASAPQGDPSAGTLPAATQLIVGTLKLEGTEQAVTAEQAIELLPLWQTLQVLSESDTAATEEKEALVAQIQETMTAEQTQAIQGMNLTRADMMSIMREQGTALGGPQNSASQNANSSGGRNFGPGAGGPPDEVRVDGGGGGFGGGGQNISADQIATAQAARQANQNSTSPMLIKAVIEYLQEKAGS